MSDRGFEQQGGDQHGFGQQDFGQEGLGPQGFGQPGFGQQGSGPGGHGSTFTERIEVAGNDLVARVKELAKDADARRVIIRDQDDKELLSFPLSWGVAGGAVAVFAAPLLAAVAAVGGLAAKVKLEVERVGEAPTPHDGQPGPTGQHGQHGQPGTVQGHTVQDDPPPSGGEPHLPPPPPID